MSGCLKLLDGLKTHLLNPSDTANGASEVNDTATLEYLKSTFMAHYNGKRQPFGLYTHPIHVSVSLA